MTTKHTCNQGNGPVFGRRTTGCPRCDELANDAKPVVWAGNRAAREDAQRCREIDAAAHSAAQAHFLARMGHTIKSVKLLTTADFRKLNEQWFESPEQKALPRTKPAP